MGQYFKIVNPVKRQYLDASSFGENIKASGFMIGYHAIALAVIVCNSDEVPKHYRYGPLAGSWCGDPIYAAGDDYGLPNLHGIVTSTEENPQRNLNQMAKEEFEDISYRAIAMLCEGGDYYSEAFAKRVAESPDSELIVHLGNVIFQIGCEPLKKALIKELGEEWTKLYKGACNKWHF